MLGDRDPAMPVPAAPAVDSEEPMNGSSANHAAPALGGAAPALGGAAPAPGEASPSPVPAPSPLPGPAGGQRPESPGRAPAPPQRGATLAGMSDALEAAGFVRAQAPAAPPEEPARAAAGRSGRRARGAGLEIALEPVLDYAETAALATEGFGAAPGTFEPARLRWLYERAFSGGTTVLAARIGARKVGQIALLHQSVAVAGRDERAVALIDLFLLKEFRSRAAMAALYGAVEAFCVAEGVRFIVAVPNGKAAGVNVRHLKLAEAARLDIRVGLSGWPVLGPRVASHRVADLDPGRGRAMLAPFCGHPGSCLLWTPDRLWDRLGRPDGGYALHLGRDVLLVSAPRSGRRAAHTLLCALFPRAGSSPGRRDVAAAVSAACRLHRRPLFVYAGRNDALASPGWLLPARLRPSPMVLQMRDFAPDRPAPSLSRFEPLDFDFG